MLIETSAIIRCIWADSMYDIFDIFSLRLLSVSPSTKLLMFSITSWSCFKLLQTEINSLSSMMNEKVHEPGVDRFFLFAPFLFLSQRMNWWVGSMKHEVHLLVYLSKSRKSNHLSQYIERKASDSSAASISISQSDLLDCTDLNRQ